MKTKTIRQIVKFKASPLEVYETLMDSKKHSAFSGAKATISKKIGGKISAYDEYISGVNIMLVPGKQIVQSWRGSDWPEGHFSNASFAFKKIAGGTQLTFIQEGVPEDQYRSIKQGWLDYYWKPMKDVLK